MTSRFDEFISVLGAIESLDLLVKDNLIRLSTIREKNKIISERLAQKAIIVNKTIVKL